MVHLHVQSGRASSLRRWEMRKTHWRTDEERIEAHRAFFARFVAARAGVAADSELAEAFRYDAARALCGRAAVEDPDAAWVCRGAA